MGILGFIIQAAMASPHGLEDAACTHCHTDPHPVGDRACVDCHDLEAWAPSTFTAVDHAALAFPLEGKHADVPCRDCHLELALTGLPTACADCHVDRHRGKLGQDCTECHSVEGFRPVEEFDHTARTAFALVGQHSGHACEACHAGANGAAMSMTPTATCATCHGEGHGAIGTCRSCHAEDHTTFTVARRGFDHRPTTFRLQRRHRSLACRSCHPKGQTTAPDPACRSCHVDVHAGQLGTVCSDCHRPDRWTVARFDHDQTSFPLQGRHFVAPCGSCHTMQNWIGLNPECFTCHERDLLRAPAAIEPHLDPFANCAGCHNTWTFSL